MMKSPKILLSLANLTPMYLFPKDPDKRFLRKTDTLNKAILNTKYYKN